MKSLGKIEPVPLRDIWRDEARDFTPWLASEEGLAALGEILGMELALVATESAVGGYRADILAKLAAGEEEEEHLVIIENQLDITNHDHLGKIITYAAGHEAVSLVWLAADFRDEHRQALDWLNEHFTGISCFGLQITAVRIGDSPAAPQFKLISSPNEWTRVVRQESGNKNTLSQTRLECLRFWENLNEYVSRQKNGRLFTRKALGRSFYDVALGSAAVHLALYIAITQQKQRVVVYIKSDDPKALFDRFFTQKESIEASIGCSLIWDRGEEDRKSCRIILERSGDLLDPAQRAEILHWFYTKTEDFYRVFEPFARSL